MNKQPIFTVTTVRAALAAGSRCVGFSHDFYEVFDLMSENVGDINECGHYPFAVIERVEPGFYTYPRREWWYKWDHESGMYMSCDKPERFKRTVGWSIG